MSRTRISSNAQGEPFAVLGRDEQAGLLSVDQAREQIVAAFTPLPLTSLPILEAAGMVLAEKIVASGPLPPFSNSAMDGFAVRSADVASATSRSPVALKVVAEAAAGHVINDRVEAGAAVRIMTGAPVPEGADAVVRFEETNESGDSPCRSGDEVMIFHAARPGEDIRPAGEDLGSGDEALAAGTVLHAVEIGLLAAIGRVDAVVHRRPNVAVLATGDEIADVGCEPGPGQIRNSNSPMVAALVQRDGGEPIVLGVARDSTAVLKRKLGDARRSADLILTTGGVSVGDYDFVKEILKLEGTVDLWQVRIKPGKPLAFGQIGATPLIGLPGNPVAAAVAYEQFARPAIKRMLGYTDLDVPTVPATLLDRVENPGGRRSFVRVRVERAGAEGFTARVAGSQGSGVLTSLVRANGLLIIPEEIEVAEPGMSFSVQMLDWNLS
jgi:molybdopterin molybdotransferase